MQSLRGFEAFLFVLGLALLAAALVLVFTNQTVEFYIETGTGVRKQHAPNIVSAGAACGFSIAGGLCFVAAALLRHSDRREQ